MEWSRMTRHSPTMLSQQVSTLCLDPRCSVLKITVLQTPNLKMIRVIKIRTAYSLQILILSPCIPIFCIRWPLHFVGNLVLHQNHHHHALTPLVSSDCLRTNVHSPYLQTVKVTKHWLRKSPVQMARRGNETRLVIPIWDQSWLPITASTKVSRKGGVDVIMSM